MVAVLAYTLWLGLWGPGNPSAGPAAAAAQPASDPDVAWIRYRLGRGESVTSVAARYEVPLEEIGAANAGQTMFGKGDVVRLQPRRFAPPRASMTIKSNERRTWDEVATRHGVEVRELRGWNPRFATRKRVPPGATLTLWFDSGVTRFPYATDALPLPNVELDPGGYSVGKPNRGRIDHAVPLPASDLYTIRFDRLAWGSSYAVQNIQRALAGFRRDSGFAGAVRIGAMSRKSGRRLRPHRSHQSGRDVDVRMPAMSRAKGYKLQRNEIDWHATWLLIDAFVHTGAVQVIFVERNLFARLRSAAMRLGASDAQIEAVMSHVRHSKGHTAHIHVRFNCATEAPNCSQVD